MSTTVTGTLVDQKGQVWSLASVQFRLQKAPNSNDRYTLDGAPFNLTPSPVVTNSAGAFSIVLPANNEISPDTSSWQCTITPDATSEAVVLVFKLITGALDISATFATVAKISPINSKYIPRAYVDSEVIVPPNAGQLYYNVTEKALKYYESGVWVAIGSGGGGGGGGGGTMVYPPPGVAVSTGTSWASSIDPATIPRTNVSNTFTQPNSFSSNVVVNGDFGVGGITYLSSNTLRISNRDNVGIPSPGSPAISTDNTSFIINSSPNGGIYFNWDSGRGIFFGDGAGHVVASLDNAGNVLFTGSISSYNKIDINGSIIGRTGLSISGTPALVNGAVNISGVNNTAYFDSISTDSNRGSFSFRQTSANGGNLLETINIDPNGTMLLRGVLNLSSNSSAGITVGSQGTTHTWNIASGNGETDFINTKGGGSGGFRWYNVPDGSVVNAGTEYLMSLNHQSYLDVRGGGSFQLGLVVTQDLTVGGNFQIGGSGNFGGSVTATNLTATNMISAPSFQFTGLFIAGQGLRVQTPSGILNAYPDALNISSVGDVAYYDACGQGTTFRGEHQFRTRHGDGSDSFTYLYLNQFASYFNLVVYAPNFVAQGAFSTQFEYPLDTTKTLNLGALVGVENAVYLRGEARMVNHVAVVDLPIYFELLTFEDSRSVLLTQVLEDVNDDIATSAASRIVSGQFTIRSTIKDALIAWEVKAIRKLGVDRLEIIRNKEN